MKMSALPSTSSSVDLEALHRRLQRADRIDLGDDHAAALAAQRLRAALADLAEAEHDRDLAAEHHVGGAVEAVGQRVAAAVDVVELALGDRVVDVDRREQQRAGFLHLIEAVHAGGRLFADAADALGDLRPARPDARLQLLLIVSRMTPHSSGSLSGLNAGNLAGLLEFVGLVHEERRVTAVVHDERRTLAVGPHERFDRAPPVLSSVSPFQAYTGMPFGLLDRAPGLGPADDDRGRRMILRREDVARDPAHVGAELGERLDQHAGLDRHVQAAHDARAGKRLLPE
jgi:hypothetical protein